MAPYAQINSRNAADDGSSSNPVTPVFIGGIAFIGAMIFGLCVWLGIYTFKKHKRKQQQRTFVTIKEGISDAGAKIIPPKPILKGPPGYFPRDRSTLSIIRPHQNTIQPDASKDEIFRHHISNRTMTRPFSVTVSNTMAPNRPKSSNASRPVSVVSFLGFPDASGIPRSKRSSSVSFSGMRPTSMASTFSNASTIFGVEARKVRQVFSGVLPDELILSLGEKVVVIKSFDDGWCIVGRDSSLKPGEVEMGAVPAWCFVKPAKGLKASRPMRTSSLGVTVQVDAAPAASREEVISWSNF